MREIKFRKWDGDEKEMIPAESLAFEEYAPLVDLLAKEKHLMQFTGLKDKHGKEIYEGDILQTEGEANSQVIFLQGCFCGKEINGWDPMTDYYPLGGGNVCNSIIIGNIYQNPELLKEETP